MIALDLKQGKRASMGSVMQHDFTRLVKRGLKTKREVGRTQGLEIEARRGKSKDGFI